MYVQHCECACFLLMVGLYITGSLLIGMGNKLESGELCSHTLADKPSKELMWCMVHSSSSKARWVLLSS